MDSLPRVRVGRLLLVLAKWNLRKEEVAALRKEEGSKRIVAAQELRRKRALPRWVVFHEGDHLLAVDFENALSVDAFVHVLKDRADAKLIEMYPSPDRLLAMNAEGHFHHELNVPFVRTPQIQVSEDVSPITKQKHSTALTVSGVNRETRTLPPGSEWLYVKIYGGEASLDNLLTTVVLPLVRTTSFSDAVSRWFFVRYSDPHAHLRIRFNGTPTRLSGEVLPQLFATFNPLVSAGKIWKIELDTYEREIERYAGAEALLAAEDIFFADSESVLDILQKLEGDIGENIRWRICLLGIDRLLSDCDMDDHGKRAALTRWRAASQREFKIDAMGKNNWVTNFASNGGNWNRLASRGSKKRN